MTIQCNALVDNGIGRGVQYAQVCGNYIRPVHKNIIRGWRRLMPHQSVIALPIDQQRGYEDTAEESIYGNESTWN